MILLPIFAQADLASFVHSIFGDQSSNSKTPNLNSQKMALLEAAISPSQSVGGGDITIVEGSTLVPEGGPVGQPVSLLQERGNSQVSTYVVREGDTLSQIANMFSVSVNTIKWGNDIKGNTISPGQNLVILPISGVRHTVKTGDTLDSIAKTYRGDVEEIMAFNGISTKDVLFSGQIIIVPDGIVPTSSSSGSSSKSKSSGSSSQPVYEGYYQRPIVGGKKSQQIHGYNAVDLAAPIGTNVLASASGVVTVSRGSGWNGGYGSYIVISHPNGTQTLYAHNSANLVVAGERVSQGQVIGRVGSTGRSTGPHVHFEVRGAQNPF